MQLKRLLKNWEKIDKKLVLKEQNTFVRYLPEISSQ